MLSPWKQLVLDAPFWFAVSTLFLVVLSWARFRSIPGGLQRACSAIQALFSNFLVVTVLAVAGLATSALALYMSYVAPWDIMQDVVSAQQLLGRKSPYPTEMKALMRAALQAEPPAISLAKWIPALRLKEASETGGFLDRQAHPPHLIFLTVPLVALFGVHGAVLAMNLLSLASLGGVLALAYRGLQFQLSTPLKMALCFAFLGWPPVLTLLRQGQSGLLLAVPLAIAWFYLRRGHQARAGIALGFATCMKLYPGLLLIYFLLKYRRGFAAAVCTVLALVALPLIWVEPKVYLEYAAMAGATMSRFGRHPLNISLVGALRKSGFAVGNGVYVVGAVAIVASVAAMMRRPTRLSESGAIDIQYSVFLALMLLLSPIAWEHYLVILILPILVLAGKVLRGATSWLSLAKFFALISVLSLPLDLLVVPFLVRGKAWTVNPLTATIPTVALIALTAWLMELAASGHIVRDASLPSAAVSRSGVEIGLLKGNPL